MAELSPEVAAIPLLNVQAGPRDAEQWMERVKEEYLALIQYIKARVSDGIFEPFFTFSQFLLAKIMPF